MFFSRTAFSIWRFEKLLSRQIGDTQASAPLLCFVSADRSADVVLRSSQRPGRFPSRNWPIIGRVIDTCKISCGRGAVGNIKGGASTSLSPYRRSVWRPTFPAYKGQRIEDNSELGEWGANHTVCVRLGQEQCSMQEQQPLQNSNFFGLVD